MCLLLVKVFYSICINLKQVHSYCALHIMCQYAQYVLNYMRIVGFLPKFEPKQFSIMIGDLVHLQYLTYSKHLIRNDVPDLNEDHLQYTSMIPCDVTEHKWVIGFYCSVTAFSYGLGSVQCT